MIKIIFAGTPEIAAGVLQALITAKHSVIACLTQPDRQQGRGLHLAHSPVKVCAIQHDIPVLQPTKLKDPIIQQQLRDLQPDLMIVLAYGLLLPNEVLTIPKYGCINIHASILPRWRGAAPIQSAILHGDQTTGITLMQMDTGLDTGDILDTYTCPIYENDTSATLYERLTILAQNSILDGLEKLESGLLHGKKQDDSLACYAPKIEKQQAKINWHSSAISINRCIRAYNPWPVAFSNIGEHTIRIWQAEVVKDAQVPNNAIPGTILKLDKYGLQVATADGVLRLLSVQFPGKKQLPIIEICHSNKHLEPGNAFT